MKVKLSFSTQFNDILETRDFYINVSGESAALANILDAAKEQCPNIKKIARDEKPFMMFVVDDKIIKMDTMVFPETEIKVYFPICGG